MAGLRRQSNGNEMMSVKLSAAALGRLPKGVAAPGYDRADLSPGIVHIGVGNFHRAHQAVYLDDLFASGRDHDWAIIGAGVREYDIDMRAKLGAQDWLTTVVEQEAQATKVRVTGPMIDFVKPFDVAAMLETLSRPAIRIVSLTVTEGGYCIDPATQKFDPRHPEIAYDAAHFDAPKSAFGLIAAGLKRRRASRRRAVHRHVVRQHSRQRPCLRERGRRARRVGRSRALRLDSRQGRVPQFDGRPHHAGDRRPRARDPQGSLRRRGQLAGVLRRVPPVGGRGPLPGRAAGAGERRRRPSSPTSRPTS